MKKSVTSYKDNEHAYGPNIKENFGAFSIGAALKGCSSCGRNRNNVQVAGVS